MHTPLQEVDLQENLLEYSGEFWPRSYDCRTALLRLERGEESRRERRGRGGSKGIETDKGKVRGGLRERWEEKRKGGRK